MGADHRGLDGFAQDELLAHFFHRPRHGGADHRLAQTADRRAQMADDARRGFLEHLAGQQQRPGRGIDQRRGRLPQMPPPVRWRDLVFDQPVHGFGIRHPQQRLGQTHQRNALVGRQAIFDQKHLHQPRPHIGADLAHQIGARGRDLRPSGHIQLRLGEQPGQKTGLVLKRAGFDLVPKLVGRGHGASPDLAHDTVCDLVFCPVFFKNIDELTIW